MSKTTKLIKHPISFFKDLKILNGMNKFQQTKTYKNIFIISNLSQLNIIKNIIEYEKLKDILLVVLYTNKNTKMPKLILNEAKKDIFEQIVLFLLPNGPMNLKLTSYITIKKDYEKLIKLYQPNYVYLLSFEAHYSILANIAQNNGAKLILIDEGTGTYKDKKELNFNILKKNIWRYFNLDSAFKWANNFSKIYASNPECLKNNFFANEFIKFSPHLDRFKSIDNATLSLIQKYNITNDDIIYTNQRYTIEIDDFVDTIILILDIISKKLNSKIFIKMHPKDHDTTIKIFKEKLSDFKNIILILDNAFLIEQSIRYIHPKAVISLTSTTLVTTQVINKNIKSYSIADWFCNIVPKTDRNLIGIKQIEEHKEILYRFQNIEFIKNGDFVYKPSQIIMQKDENKELYIENFKSACLEHKYFKAILNFQLAYNDDILSATFDEIINFLYCLELQNGITSINNFLNILTDRIIKTNNSNFLSYEKYKILKVLLEIAIKHIDLGHIRDSFVLLDNIFMLFTLFNDKLENDKYILASILLKSDCDLYSSLMQFYFKCEEKLILVHNKQKYVVFCNVLDKNRVFLNQILTDKYIIALEKTKQYLKIQNIAHTININEKNIYSIINAYYNLSNIKGAKDILDKYDYLINTDDFLKLNRISNIYELNQDYEKALKYINLAVQKNPSKLTQDLRLRKFHIQQFIKFKLDYAIK
ncbi:Alpha-2%2C8-polysialyltransferase (POLYST) [Campylobacter hyointestinalis subsp. hyointestinalis]|uniref:Alpha-2,8-polysialyltransferase (POLYST) n=1 Tax=Campylobacter hyointestinalis subsp. hyointestinalis TaxID=91352 RepID=A0A9W5ATC0_CAMHY|nr:polysialyltransferase family glycosyltransferase [Campylobacter hyointestinalis]CUU70689.1 Alpha-2%2C8-polysialyltransferase (POLYST) [Campylobacter hyointestinalis subsp. hyointestinalis]CUU70690.1 Alpha-2%2C8-polysialyltransferase (POLYST) [Campylobacter hyointestinalis subsp. hyointestinalis]CUU85631.1 Alpha-2%2C8-polysialyltransferase (POLYST) [Campylobacter hyointestinalis subsp. hyointestinalis]